MSDAPHPLAPLPDELRQHDLDARDETRGEFVPTFTADESGLDALNNLDGQESASGPESTARLSTTAVGPSLATAAPTRRDNLDAPAPEPARRAADVRWAGKAAPGDDCTATDDPAASSGELHVGAACVKEKAERPHGAASDPSWEEGPADFQTWMARAYVCLERAKRVAPTVLLTAQTAAVASRIGPGALARDVRHLMEDGAEHEPLQPDEAA